MTAVTGVVGAPLYLVADSIQGVSIGIPMLVIGLVLIGEAFFIRYSRKNPDLKAPKTFKEMKKKD